MKKALVMTFVLVLGFGLFAWAQTWEGTWDTDITVYPSVAEFSDFIGFDSDLTVTYSIGGWDFSMDADFSVGGMDGLGFDAEGVIGAFSFDIDMDFAPMYKTAETTVYTADLEVIGTPWTTAACLQTDSWTFTKKTVTNTYMPAFDDLTASMDVSIAGVSLGALFFLESTDSDVEVTHTSWEFAGLPQQADSGTINTVQTASQIGVTPATKVGSGGKFTLSGSLAGATATSYTYFNLIEKMYNDGNASTAHDYVYNSLKKYGSIYGLACAGCTPAFYEQYFLIEGLALFGECLELDMGLRFTCCNFQWVGFLLRDIGLGCCWDLGFDLFVKFETTAKTVTFEPEITLANACFTIDAAVDYTFDSGTFSIDGIEIEGISYTHTFNGVTVTFAQTWDYDHNPLTGTDSTITHEGGSYVYFWKPDVNASADDHAIDLTTPYAGQWVLTAISCGYEKATVYNKLSLDFDADGCCGGLFDLDVDTYFGSLASYTLAGVYGTYYFDDDYDGIYQTDEQVEYLGDGNGYADYALLVSGTTVPPTASASGPNNFTDDECDPCDAEAVRSESSQLVGYYGTGTTIYSIFGWVKTAADISFGVGSNITIDLGIDVAWWGWNSLSFGITFEW